MFTSSIKCGYPSSHGDVIEQLLEVTTASVKKLIIKIVDSFNCGHIVLHVFEKLLKNANHAIPSVINIKVTYCPQVVTY